MQIVVFTLVRTALNTAHRMVYPFLPTFARGLGVDLQAVALGVTARSALGLLGPVFGLLADRRGRRAAMLAGLLCFTVGMALVALWPGYPTLFAALLLGSASKLFFDPAMQAYIGDRVHYTRRGLALALTEVSWSGAFLIGVPFIGWLIDRTGTWRAPFPLLAAAGLVGMLLVARAVPSDQPQPTQRPPLAQGLRLVWAARAARAGLALGFLISMGNELIGIVYGAWMEDAFGLKVTALGATAIVIGIAELLGEGGVAGFVDRVGKRRAVIGGVALNAAAGLLLPLLGEIGVGGALVGLFWFYLTFEFAMVSSIPLMTELVPGARATLMAANVTAFAAGRMIGALVGPLLFTVGLLANGIACAALNGLALVAVIVFVRQD